MIKKFCDSCGQEMHVTLTLKEDGLEKKEYEICGNCAAKVLNLLRLPTKSTYIDCVRKFPENQPEDTRGAEV